MAFRGGPELNNHGRLGQFGSALGPIAATKQYGLALQHARHRNKLAGIKGYEKARMQIAKIQKIKAAILCHSHRGTMTQATENPPQPGCPFTEEPADFKLKTPTASHS